MNEITTLEALKYAEEAIGLNLQWLSDRFDLEIRQKNQDTMDRLAMLNVAWVKICKAIANEQKQVA